MSNASGMPVNGGYYDGYGSSSFASGGNGYRQGPDYMYSSPSSVPQIVVGDAVRWAWSRTFANPLIIAWVPLALLLMGLVLAGLFSLVDNGSINAAIGVPTLLITLLIIVLGLQSAALRIARGETVAFRSLVAPPNALDAVAVLVLVGVMGLLASFLPLGGLVSGYFFWVAVPVAMNEGSSCFKAIGRSCRLMSRGGNAPLLGFVLILIHLAGMLTVIGCFVTIPMINLMTAYVYMRVTGQDVVR